MPTSVLAIDPGPTDSAYVVAWMPPEFRILHHGKVPNATLRFVFRSYPVHFFVLERVASYGMAVGAEVFETCYWSGRHAEAAAHEWAQVPGWKLLRPTRPEVKLAVCGTSRAKDANVRQAVIDRYGAPGTKKNQGPTYGLRADEWQALALVRWLERMREEGKE